MTKKVALDLVKLGMYVFPCREKVAVINAEEYAAKSPYTTNGFQDASNDPEMVNHWWTEHPAALVGVWAGPSRIVVLDVDVKRDDKGRVTVDGFDDLDQAWLDVPETYSYTTFGGEGTHYIYLDPQTETVGPKTKYRGMRGVDRRAGGSYAVWTGDVPTSRDVFTAAPEWLLDASEVRTAAEFEGDVKAWFDGLTPGEPNILVRRAIDRIKPDMTHQEMVSAQFEAVRLGAEGNPGVPDLLAALEDAWMDRPAENHSTPEQAWEYKFVEALASGVEKYGGAIELVKSLPEYSLSLIPAQVPDRLVSGEPGDRSTFNQLLAGLVEYELDDKKVLSVLWNCPTTRNLAREWGLEFTFKRVTDARVSPPPVKENPALEDAQERRELEAGVLLTDAEKQSVRAHRTFIDCYLDASAAKGFSNEEYDIPAAWTLLSMAFGQRAFIPKGVNLGMNLWFNVLGYSGTGKSSADDFLKVCLDLLLKNGETYYNLGAGSSPEALHEALLERDKKPSIIHHDEASDFFENLRKKDWMSSLKDLMAKWYMGYVDPMQKVRLKDLRGKSAHTSFNVHMLATPDRLLGLVDTSMFETGFLARFNWVWGSPPVDDEVKYLVSRSRVNDDGINPRAYDLVTDLLFAVRWMPPNKALAIDWSDEVEDRIIQAHMAMDETAKKRDYYTATEPAVTRLGRDTIWKCAALLALYRGETMIQMRDALAAIYYTERWFNDLFRVVEAAGEGDFKKDADKIEAYIRSRVGGVSQARVYDRFGGMIKSNSRELDDRIGFLLTSGRIIRDPNAKDRIVYKVNGGGE